MLKACLIGLGGMGRGHFDNYVRAMKEGKPVELVAVCDIDPEKFKNVKVDFNIKGIVSDSQDMSAFRQYTDADEMLAAEKPDLVTIAIPTYLHADMAIKCMKAGANVLSEKPMSLCPCDCKRMIDTAKETGRKLMIGQCLRFWGEYEAAKKLVDSGVLGAPMSGYFWRGGGAPAKNDSWYLHRDMSGGCLFDQHVHDVDIIQYFYGMPKAVCSLGRKFYPDAGQDCVSTNYIYDGGFAINAQDDWTLKGRPFSMTYRMNFENGSIYMDEKGFNAYDADGNDITPEYDKENAYYKEMLYLADCVINGKENTVNPPEDSMKAIQIAKAEQKSADNNGAIIIL